MNKALASLTALWIAPALALAQVAAQDPAELIALKTGELAKCGAQLSRLYQEYGATQSTSAQPPIEDWNPLLKVVDGYVLIDAVAIGNGSDLEADLMALGMRSPSRHGRFVSGWLPIERMPELAACATLRFARPAAAKAGVGLVTSRGDRTLRSDLLRRATVDDDEIELDEDDDDDGGPRIDGSGVTVGSLSDSFDCRGGAAADVASGDLPPGIVVLDDSQCPGSDEGRAMMQIIADVAPGADQAFHSAFGGQADFANGIVELATQAGAQVIVDDVKFFAEPMFQDGIIAQAVDAVRSLGVAYFSSAGNEARSAYESSFRNSGVTGVFGGPRHDFDPGPAVDDLQTFTVAPGDFVIFSYQWDEPFFSVSGAPGSASDVDILFYDTAGNFLPFFNGQLVVFQGFAGNLGGDPVEVAAVLNLDVVPVAVQIGLEVFAGPLPGLQKYVFFNDFPGSGVVEFDTASGASYGHANAAGGEAVGAVAWFNHPLFNSNISEPRINFFSSAGPTPILFDTSGNRLAQPEVRLKPELVGPDGVNTTFFGINDALLAGAGIPGEPDGFPNFFGTSAAAPHVAGVAALLFQTALASADDDDDGSTPPTPDEIFAALEQTARDMTVDPVFPDVTPGFDFRTGFGFVDALAAARALVSEDDDDDDDD